MINNQFVFLGQGGSVLASAADIILDNHFLSITGTPQMDYRKMRGTPGWKESLHEELAIWTYTPVAAVLTTYTIVVSQWNASVGRNVIETLTYQTAASGDTATTICAAMRAQLLTKLDLQVVGSGTSTLILTGVTGSPLFTVTNNQPSTSTVVASPLVINITSSTDATPIVVTVAATTGLNVGDTVVIAGHTTNVAANGTWRLSVVTGTTFTLENSAGSGAGAGAAGTVTQTAQYARGTYASFSTFVPAAQIPAGVTTTQTYTTIVFNYISEGGETNGMPNYSINRVTLFVNEAATNFSTFKTRMNEVIAALGSGLTTPDPETVSIGNKNLGGL